MGVPIYLDNLSGNEGWILAEPIRNEQGSILYPADKPLDTNTVEMLKKHFIKATNNKGSISKIHLQVKLNHKNLTPAQKIIIENIEKSIIDITHTNSNVDLLLAITCIISLEFIFSEILFIL